MEIGLIKKQILNLVSLLPTKVILFGSQVYRNPNEARRALKDLRMPIDIIVVHKEEFEFYRHCPNTIHSETDKRVIVLYAK
jgi:hypothetical protein